MPARSSPQAALYGRDRPLPALAPCVHYAGSERFIAKALALQGERRLAFDVAAGCEDGAPVRAEREHVRMVARLIAGPANRCDRAGARIHDRGSYRHFWNVLQRAHAAGIALPLSAADCFRAADA